MLYYVGLYFTQLALYDIFNQKYYTNVAKYNLFVELLLNFFLIFNYESQLS